ncbi:alginate export family protein [Terriglobus aquaticus]|uniref:Alginate export family protein n=1 Tax=Terriglobus aquaticus TaxID=940139 RepID=A0ABW9KJT3_9BACT|nr:alginate export family protein [Terriglobus aquaticus]
MTLLRSLLLACIPAAISAAQSPVPDTRPQTPVLPANAPAGKPVVNVLLRERGNATQWFGALPNPETYGHGDSLLRLSLAQRLQRLDWQLEMSNSAELALPTDAVSPVSAQGQLGLGGTYFASNSNNNFPAAVSFKTGFARFHFHNDKGLFRLGRFEFLDGAETTPKNTALNWVQTNRIAQRLIGNFGFSNGQRSLDGVDLKIGGTNWDVTAMGARADQGVFKMNANEELNVDVQYLAYTRYLAKQRVQFRTFGLGYHDGRTGLTKTDNRTAAARALDHKNIRIGSFGGDLIAALPVGRQTFDLLAWGVGQTGRWGLLDHKAGAVAVEGGLRLETVRTKPWLRGGFLRSTGDNNNTDGTHNTFFQVLPTPRNYARYPFFNMMNSKDEFVQLIDKPAARLDLRTDLHFLQLTAPSDFWYQGGGAYDNKAFGYIGRPGNNHGSFTSLYDISADVALTKQFTFTTYYAHAFGKTVIKSIYPIQTGSNYGYIELLYHGSHSLR